MENREINTEEIKAVMIAVPDEKTDETELDKSFDELSGLLQTAGARGIFTLAQRREKPDVRMAANERIKDANSRSLTALLPRAV